MTAPYRKVAYLKLLHKYELIVSLMFIAPLVVCVLGVIVVLTGNERVNSINKYLFFLFFQVDIIKGYRNIQINFQCFKL